MDCSPRRRCDFGKPNSPFGEMVSVGVFGSGVEVVRETRAESNPKVDQKLKVSDSVAVVIFFIAFRELSEAS